MPNRLSVVLVEDEDTDAELILRLLSGQHDVRRLRRYRDLLSIAYETRFQPDIVMLDLGLPDTYGLDQIAMVRNIVREFRTAAIVVLTGMADHEVAVKCRGVGAQEYLFKEPALLRNEIDQKLRGAYAHKQLELRHLSAAESMSDFIDPSALDRRIEAAVNRAVDGVVARLRDLNGHDPTPPTPLNKVKAWVRANYWKIISAAAATVLYLVDFRDRIRDYTRETEEFRVETTKAVESQEKEMGALKEDVADLQRAIITNQVLQVRSVEQLQREIRIANPRGQYPQDPPELQAAKDAVQEIDARRKLFEPGPVPK